MPRVDRQITVQNRLGLHVRPAAQLAAAAMKFRSEVRISREGGEVNAKSSLDLLTLAAVAGTVLTVRAEGDDADAAVQAIESLIASRFGEE